MTIPLTGPQSLFVRLGHIFGTFNQVNDNRSTLTLPHVDTIFSDFETTNQDIVDNLYSSYGYYQNSGSTFQTYLQQTARNVILEMVNDDNPQNSQTSISECLATLIEQMKDSSDTVQSCFASSEVTASVSNNGDANIVIGLLGNNGLVRENVFREEITATVVADSQSNGATLGSELIAFLGQYQIGDFLSQDYPVGSSCNISISCVNASLSQRSGNGNHLNNSNFESWTVANIPDAWHISTGTAGSTVKKSTTVFFDGLASLELVGNGSENTKLYQQFATTTASGDTSTRIASIFQYVFNLWMKVDVVPASGSLRFALTDGAGTVLTDEQGVASSVLIDLTTLGTTFAPYHGFLRTPRVLPSSVRFEIKLETPLPSGSSVFLDRLSMSEPVALYQGGPYVAAFSGDSALINGDSFGVEIYNDYGGMFQRLFERFFGMRSLNLLLPSSDTPTISDSLIV